MQTIGPHRFSATDAERTVASIPVIWELLAQGRDAAVIEPLRPAFTGDIAVDLPLAWEAMLAAGPALRAAGQLPARTEGRVDALHRSDGGVPKLPADRVEVGFSGVVGDRQATRQ
ncbi:MAG: hypothetical protein RLZZ362_2593, partial [Actinomycetota bacterium]